MNDKIIINVNEEINDAEVMANDYAELVENDEVKSFHIINNKGDLEIVFNGNENHKIVTVEDLKKIDGIIDVRYDIGSYVVTRKD